MTEYHEKLQVAREHLQRASQHHRRAQLAADEAPREPFTASRTWANPTTRTTPFAACRLDAGDCGGAASKPGAAIRKQARGFREEVVVGNPQ